MPETLSEAELDEVYERFEEYSRMQHPLDWNHVIVGRILATLRLSRNEVAARYEKDIRALYARSGKIIDARNMFVAGACTAEQLCDKIDAAILGDSLAKAIAYLGAIEVAPARYAFNAGTAWAVTDTETLAALPHYGTTFEGERYEWLSDSAGRWMADHNKLIVEMPAWWTPEQRAHFKPPSAAPALSRSRSRVGRYQNDQQDD